VDEVMMTDDIQSYLFYCQQRIVPVLRQRLPHSQDKLHQAMRYAVLNGGKRLRPALVYAVGDLFNIGSQVLDYIACVLELIHCYSLIHDDLPAMDNDDFRRGKPTCHHVFGQAIAILAGDALQTLAFQLMAKSMPDWRPRQQIMMIEKLSQSVGCYGMAHGQALEIDDSYSKDLYNIKHIYHKKTSLLIKSCIDLPIIFSSESKDSEYLAHLDHYGDYLGLAFQIQDDILDVKKTNALFIDQDSQKKTHHSLDKRSDLTKILTKELSYPAIVGMKCAKKKRQALYQKAMATLEAIGLQQSYLAGLAHYMVTREI